MSTTPAGSDPSKRHTGRQDDPWADEPSESVWETVPSSGQGQTAGTATRFTPRDGPPAPRTESVAYANLDDEEEDNVWAEARNQPAEANKLSSVPEVLRPGPSASRPTAMNPFRRKPAVGQPPSGASTPSEPPTDAFAKLELNDQSSNPWQSSGGAPIQHTDHAQVPVFPSEEQQDPWVDAAPQGPPPGVRPPKGEAAPSPALISLPSEEGSAWGDEPRSGDEKAAAQPVQPLSEELLDGQHVWDEIGAVDKGKGKEPDSSSEGQDEWNMIDTDSSPSPTRETAAEKPHEGPTLPARTAEAETRWVPTRQPVDGAAETYQVKNIRWHDPSGKGESRKSPILVQNENGPCPLVALVNALSLTTPADIEDTALVQVLRSREQVSLNLVLDAVFEELMSPRRTQSDASLPDIGDLYAFLQSLHTGMNVNPRFIPAAEVVEVYKNSNLTHLPLDQREHIVPGTFENTAEMGLYATFSIPLIHGWLPWPGPVYDALQRQAVSYEDAQNLLFREEELDDKLSNASVGLSPTEQQIYQDILVIKTFLDASATQLTPRGISVIEQAIRPGSFAILFRNDHFSTLYCHPHTKQLMTLVTDAGYRGHDEVVWETLVDVNGERSQFLSGDFRAVGGTSSGAAGSGNLNSTTDSSSGGNKADWTTVQNRRGKARTQVEAQHSQPAVDSTEQEDRDLALALQLQEEEDQRHREQEARRQQESRLSEQFIEQQGHQQPTPVNRGPRNSVTRARDDLVPGRRSSNSANVPVTTNARSPQGTGTPPQPPRPGQDVRPMVPPRRYGTTRPADQLGSDAPPSYEQAASAPAFQPPAGHPSYAERSSSGIARQTSRTSATAGRGGQMGRRPMGAGPAAVPAGSSGQDRGKDCVVM